MPSTPVTCPLDCPDACGIVVETGDRGAFARLRGNPQHGWSRGTLCAKTSLYGELVTSEERLLAPLVREGRKPGGELRRASWDEAVARIAERIAPLPLGSVLAAWYAGSMGIVARKFPLRAMHALGATLVDGGLCDASATAGHQIVLGRLVGPDIEEVEDADFLLLWGCDMKRTVQHLQPAAQRLCKRGVPVVAVDVYRTDTIRALERWGGEGVILRPGTDAALALALSRLAFERGHADRAFLASECAGAAAFEDHVLSGLGLAEASRITGVPEEGILRLAERLGRARAPFLKAGVGFARRRNGAMSMRSVCSLAAVLGAADRVHYESAEHFGLAEDAIERPDLRPPGSPREPIRHVALGEALASGRHGALFVWGHNPAVTCPDSARVRGGLASEDVFVVVHEQFLTETARLADVVLPATMFVEHADLYRSYGHRRAQLSLRACEPPGEARSNVAAFAAIARALGLPAATWDATPESLCEELLEASRDRLGAAGLAALRAGLAWKLPPDPARGRGTPSGKVELFSETAAALGQPAMASWVEDDACGERGDFWLVAAPSVFTHNSTFSHSRRHVERNGPPRVHVNPADARRLGLEEGALARLGNSRATITLAVSVCADMPGGLVRVDGMPRAQDVPEGIGINALVAPEVSDLGESNVLYSTRVDLEPVSKA